jgi:hypothetical protein
MTRGARAAFRCPRSHARKGSGRRAADRYLDGSAKLANPAIADLAQPEPGFDQIGFANDGDAVGAGGRVELQPAPFRSRFNRSRNTIEEGERVKLFFFFVVLLILLSILLRHNEPTFTLSAATFLRARAGTGPGAGRRQRPAPLLPRIQKLRARRLTVGEKASTPDAGKARRPSLAA